MALRTRPQRGLNLSGKCLALALAVATTTVLKPGAPSDARPAPPPDACQALAVPAYFPPGPQWDRALAGSVVPRYLVMNPENGPGTSADPAYSEAVARAQSAGVRVLGYVHTTYGARPAQEAESDIDRYRRWYGVDGIFLDEVSAGSAQLAYYEGLARTTRAVTGAIVALNPGVYPDEGYAALADVVVTFEGDDSDYRSSIPPSWVKRYPPGRFWHLVHASDRRALPSVIRLARERSVGNIYVTDDTLPNPWDTLASYWSSELSAVARCHT